MTIPKHLYHYTSQTGLLGILQTKKLWMTNILYLNDSSEFTHTLDLVKSELTKRINKLLQIRRKRAYISKEDFDIEGNEYQTYELIENYLDNLSYNEEIVSRLLDTVLYYLYRMNKDGRLCLDANTCFDGQNQRIPFEDILKVEYL